MLASMYFLHIAHDARSSIGLDLTVLVLAAFWLTIALFVLWRTDD
jgi:hypothetical protein